MKAFDTLIKLAILVTCVYISMACFKAIQWMEMDYIYTEFMYNQEWKALEREVLIHEYEVRQQEKQGK